MNDITAQDRRDIAENLRSIAEFPGRHVRYVEQFKELLEDEIFPDVEYHDYSDMFEQLANLIEPTCELKIQDGHACCGNCGHILADEYESEEDYWCFRPYCPDCGARVVRDEA